MSYSSASHSPLPPCASTQLLGQRQRQEDSLRLSQFDGGQAGQGLLAVVCDGMGGHAGGDIASQLVADRFVSSFLAASGSVPARLQTALTAGHEGLIEAVSERPDLEDMGTTLVAACILGDALYRVSVGDSQLWRLRQGCLQRLNDDHSMAPVFESMVAMGEMTAEAARHDRKRHALRSAITRHPISKIDAPPTPEPLLPGDYLLLASDGLDSLPPDAVTNALTQANGDPNRGLEALNEKISKQSDPGQDNTSLILICVPEQTGASADKPAIVPKPASQGVRLWPAAAIAGLVLVLLLFLILR